MLEGALLLPASTKRLVELDQGDQFTALRLGQSKLRGKRIRLIREDLKIIRGAGRLT